MRLKKAGVCDRAPSWYDKSLGLPLTIALVRLWVDMQVTD